MSDATDLGGRTALVSGASRGIGLEVARAFAGRGMRVAMLARTEDELNRRAAEIDQHKEEDGGARFLKEHTKIAPFSTNPVDGARKE